MELLAFAFGLGVLVLALCAKPIEAILKSWRAAGRRRRRQRRVELEASQFEARRRARLMVEEPASRA